MASEKQLAHLRKARAARKSNKAVVVTRIVSIGGGGDSLTAYHNRKAYNQKFGGNWDGKIHQNKAKTLIGIGKYAHLTHFQLHNLTKAWSKRLGSGKTKVKISSGKHAGRGRPRMTGPALPPGWVHVKGQGSRLALKRGRKKGWRKAA